MMRSDEALHVLSEVESVRARTRRALDSSGFPLMVFGVLTLGSVPVGMTALSLGAGFYPQIGFYWAVGATIGVVLIAVHYAWRERTSGIGDRATRAAAFTATAFAILLGALTLGLVGDGATRGFGPQLAISGGYLLFALLERRLVVATVAIVLAVIAVASWLVVGGLKAYVLSALVYAAALIWAGLVLYRER